MENKKTKISAAGFKEWVKALNDEELSICLTDERKRLDALVKSEYGRANTLTSVPVMEQSALVDVLVNEKLLRNLEEDL